MIGRRVVVPLAVAGAMVAGGVAGAVLGVPGLSGASTSNSVQVAAATGPSGATGKAGMRPGGPRADLDAAAKALGLTTEQLLDKLSDGTTTIAQIAKDKGIPIDDVIKAIADADRQRIEDFVNNPLPKHDGMRGGPGKGGFGGGMGLDAAAKALGITPQALMTELRGGKTIAQVAKDKGVNLDDVVKALIGAASDRIDKAKDAGKITQQQADDAKSKLKDRVAKIVNGELGKGFDPGPGPGGPGFGFRGGRHGPGPSTTVAPPG